MSEAQVSIFDGDRTDKRLKKVPVSKAWGMCLQNLKNRRGRYMLVFISIAVVVAFFVTTLTFQRMVGELRNDDDVHTRAVMQRAGLLLTDAAAEVKQRDRMIWLLILSGALAFVGVTNTMYMSVTERYREIGTLKCLGALDGFVVQLFIIESVLIGLVGSAIGAVLGLLLTLVQVGLTLEFGLVRGWVLFHGVWPGVPLAIIGGTVLTVLASIYPTVAAARMKPVDAMRVEV